MAYLEMKDITISFSFSDGRRFCALQGMNLSVEKGELVALLGPSGCGKSTALNILAGQKAADSGTVCINGKPVTGVNRELGYISQTDTLLPWRTVQDNVTLGLELRGVDKQRRAEIAGDLMDRMGLSAFAGSYPAALSGGMKKRAAIARVLAASPEVLLMDEPFAPLDALTRQRLQDEILSLWEKSGRTILYVTHDITEAITMADRVALMSARPGRVTKLYPIDLPRPRRVMDVKFTPRFVELERTIWQDLRQELDQAGGRE